MLSSKDKKEFKVFYSPTMYTTLSSLVANLGGEIDLVGGREEDHRMHVTVHIPEEYASAFERHAMFLGFIDRPVRRERD